MVTEKYLFKRQSNISLKIMMSKNLLYLLLYSTREQSSATRNVVLLKKKNLLCRQTDLYIALLKCIESVESYNKDSSEEQNDLFIKTL